MTRPLDHAVHAVEDLARAAAAYEDLGFVVTPPADHPFGTSNRLVVVEGAYIELIAVARPDLVTGGFADHVRRFLRSGPGIAAIALRAENIAAESDDLISTGVAMGDVATFTRPATLADGSVVEAGFSIALSAVLPSPLMFLCQHHTPLAVWDPGSMRHPNGAMRISCVGGEGRLDSATARGLGRLTGSEPAVTQDAVEFGLDGSRISVRQADVLDPGRLVLDTIGLEGSGRSVTGEVAGVAIRVGA